MQEIKAPVMFRIKAGAKKQYSQQKQTATASFLSTCGRSVVEPLVFLPRDIYHGRPYIRTPGVMLTPCIVHNRQCQASILAMLMEPDEGA
jgi:hypothetical protein